MRIFLAGRVNLEAGDRMFGPMDFPGRQGRVAFAYLVTERGHPISRE